MASAYLGSDDRVSLQDVIMTAFENKVYAVDNQNMSMTLYVSPLVSSDRLNLIFKLDLLPKPMGVRYKTIIQAAPLKTFGFSNNPNTKGFADRFDTTRIGGIFARKVINE